MGASAAAKAPKNDKAVVVVSFGSTFDDTRTKDIGGIEEAVAKAFPNRDFKRAFTSYIIMERLEKNKGIKSFRDTFNSNKDAASRFSKFKYR